MTVAIQGTLGSFHHIAAKKWYGDDVEILRCETFKDVFEAIKNNVATSGIVALENSLFGSINEVYDLLLAYRIPIVGEIPMRIEQCLIGTQSSTLSSIRHIYSHPVALAQCSDYLDSHLHAAERIEYYDTAAGVEFVRSLDSPENAAIAGPDTAKIYGMKLLKKNIENHDSNYTRFLVLDPKSQDTSNSTNKASIVLQTNHQPGALYAALGVFAGAGVNLTKLQSRPIIGKVWKYMFYIDVVFNNQDMPSLYEKLHLLGCTVTILGTYTENSNA